MENVDGRKTNSMRHMHLTIIIACLPTFVVQTLPKSRSGSPLVCRFGVWPDPRHDGQQAIDTPVCMNRGMKQV